MGKIIHQVVGIGFAVLFSIGAMANEPGTPTIIAAQLRETPVLLVEQRTDVQLVRKQQARASESEQWEVVLDGIKSSGEPGVVYQIYLGVGQGELPTPNDPRYVGALNFFGLAGVDGPGRKLLFKIRTPHVLAQDQINVTFIAPRPPIASARPEISSIFIQSY